MLLVLTAPLFLLVLLLLGHGVTSFELPAGFECDTRTHGETWWSHVVNSSAPNRTSSSPSQLVSFAQGTWLQQWIHDVREEEGADAWYEDTLSGILIEYCEEGRAYDHDRLVPPGSERRALDSSGNCIEASDGDTSLYAQGYCERTRNCYWKAPANLAARQRQYTDEEASASRNAVRDWNLEAFWSFGLYGVGCAGFPLLCSLIFFYRRCRKGLCRCERGLNRKRVGYTTSERWVFIGTFLVSGIVACTLAWWAFVGHVDSNRGITDAYATVSEAKEEMQTFVSDAASPLILFQSSLNATTEAASTMVDDSWWLSEGQLFYETRMGLNRWRRAWITQIEYDADEEDDINDAIQDIRDAVSDKGTYLEEKVLGSAELLREVSVNADGIQAEAEQLMEKLVAANETFVERAGSLEQMANVADVNKAVHVLVLWGVIALVGLSCLTGLLAIVAGVGRCKSSLWLVGLLDITWVSSGAVITFGFLLSTFAFVCAVLWSDSCSWMKLVSRDWGLVTDGTTSDTFNTCFERGKQANLFSGLNLSEPFSFALGYNSALRVTNRLNVSRTVSEITSTLDDLVNVVNGLNASALEELNSYTNASAWHATCEYNLSYTRTEVLTPWVVAAEESGDFGFGLTAHWADSSDGGYQNLSRQGQENGTAYMGRVFDSYNCRTFNDDLLDLYSSVAASEENKLTMVNDLMCVDDTDSDLNSNSNSSSPSSFCTQELYENETVTNCGCTSVGIMAPQSVYSFISEYDSNLTALQGRIREHGRVVSASVGHMESFFCQSHCGWMAQAFKTVYANVCGDTLGGLLQQALSLFLLAVFGIFLQVSSAVLAVRLKGERAQDMARILVEREENKVDMPLFFDQEEEEAEEGGTGKRNSAGGGTSAAGGLVVM